MRCVAAIVGLISMGWAAPVLAQALDYVPLSDSEVVMQLPPAVVTLANGLRASAAAVSAEQVSDPTAQKRQLLQQILTSYRLAVTENDLRAYGHTLTLADRWPSDWEQPPLLHLVKAAVLQHNHLFSLAQEELNLILEVDPQNLQALVMRSQIGLVTGDYAAVARQCELLRNLRETLPALNCQTQLDGLTGRGEQALAVIEVTVSSGGLSAAELLELHITAATIAHRLALPEQAERHYQAALGLDTNNHYVLVNYVDWLTDQGRNKEALKLLVGREDTHTDLELKLIHARILVSAEPSPSVATLLQEIDQEIIAASQRGEDAPHKLIARYALDLRFDPEQACEAALRNWSLQKEPSDILLLARAAAADGDLKILHRLQEFRDRTGLQDYRLDAVLQGAGVVP